MPWRRSTGRPKHTPPHRPQGECLEANLSPSERNRGSILRHDRVAQIEVIVQAHAKDVAFKFLMAGDEDAFASGDRVGGRHRIIYGSKVIIKIFQLGAQIAREGVLDTAADCETRADAGCAAAEQVR